MAGTGSQQATQAVTALAALLRIASSSVPSALGWEAEVLPVLWHCDWVWPGAVRGRLRLAAMGLARGQAVLPGPMPPPVLRGGCAAAVQTCQSGAGEQQEALATFLASPFPTQGSSAHPSVWLPASSHHSCPGGHCHI